MTIEQKILFTDLDGTLLNREKTISPRTFQVLKAFATAGHTIVLSTGRDLNSTKNVRRTLGLMFPAMYLIAYNGGQIYDCDQQKILHRLSMNTDDALRILETSAKMGVYSHTYTDSHIISPGMSEELAYYQRIIDTPVVFSDNMENSLTKDPNKCLAIALDGHGRLAALRAQLEHVLTSVTFAYSASVLLDMLPATSGKGKALLRLCDMLGIPPENAIAAGDAENDLPMLKAAGLSIAMCDGAASLKEVADIVTTTDNDHDGLALVLEDILGLT